MKFTWEPRDVVVGQVVGQHGRTERWMIGYDPRDPDDSKFVIVSLEDGMIVNRRLTIVGVADYLSQSGDYPVELFDFVKRADARAKAES